MKEITKRKYIRPEVTVIGLSDECPLLAGSDPSTIVPPKKQEHETCNIDGTGTTGRRYVNVMGMNAGIKKDKSLKLLRYLY